MINPFLSTETSGIGGVSALFFTCVSGIFSTLRPPRTRIDTTPDPQGWRMSQRRHSDKGAGQENHREFNASAMLAAAYRKYGRKYAPRSAVRHRNIRGPTNRRLAARCADNTSRRGKLSRDMLRHLHPLVSHSSLAPHRRISITNRSGSNAEAQETENSGQQLYGLHCGRWSYC